MPDIAASPAVDVALGLIFLFFMLSLICSTVNELVAGVLSWRSRFLEDGIRSMFSGTGDGPGADKLLDQIALHPLISGKVATPAQGTPRGLRGRLANLRARVTVPRRFPSYLNSSSFALTILDTVAPADVLTGLRSYAERLAAEHPARVAILEILDGHAPADAAPAARRYVEGLPADDPVRRSLLTILEQPHGSPNDVLARVRTFAEGLDADDPLRRTLMAFLDQAGKDLGRFRKSVESWFDLTMDRVSGWYKRRTQISLAVIATVVTLVANADALQVGRTLWNDDAVRAAVVTQAQSAVDEGAPASDPAGVSEDFERLSEQVSDVGALELPLGWSTDPDDPRWFDSFWGAVGKVLGLIATVLALTLGAPFWFDLLGRVSRVRTTGKPERPGAF